MIVVEIFNTSVCGDRHCRFINGCMTFFDKIRLYIQSLMLRKMAFSIKMSEKEQTQNKQALTKLINFQKITKLIENRVNLLKPILLKYDQMIILIILLYKHVSKAEAEIITGVSTERWSIPLPNLHYFLIALFLFGQICVSFQF